MLSLILNGRCEISEDALTAAFLDLLRYQGTELISAVLRLARPVATGRKLPEFTACRFKLWPIFDGREPDAHLQLSSDHARPVHLLYEAKLGAPKTGTGLVDLERGVGDQLAFYMLATSRAFPGHDIALLYVTHHAAFPWEDFSETTEALLAEGRRDLADQLFWLSWRDLERPLALSASEMGRDFAEVLRRVRMMRFGGVDVRERFITRCPRRDFYSPPNRLPSREAGYPRCDVRLQPFSNALWTYESNTTTRRSRLELRTTGRFYGEGR